MTALHITEQGLWAEIMSPSSSHTAPRPALFLDRDGVIVEDTHFLCKPEDVQIIPGAATTIAAANAKGIPVVIVTNQAGIAYGHYDWEAFARVQAHILATLHAETGAHVDAVFACAFHKKGAPPYHHPDHPWRKPNPGMIHAGLDALNIDAQTSWLIGDKSIDLLAARNAGLAGGIHVLSGHGSDAGEREKALNVANATFQAMAADNIAAARGILPLLKTPLVS